MRFAAMDDREAKIIENGTAPFWAVVREAVDPFCISAALS